MTTRPRGEPTRQHTARAAAWLASHPVEDVFALLVTTAFVYAMRITGRSYFFADDWRLVEQARSARGLFRPYNDHLSVIILGTYRVSAEVFGFTSYTPIRVVGLLSLFAVPLAYFLTTRREFGAVLAALLALPLLWYGRTVSLSPDPFNHYLALLGGIGCAAALNRGRRADWLLAAALAFSLCSAGGGVAVAAACLVHNVCTRPGLRRWIAVIGPTSLWLVWWLVEAGRPANLGPYALTTSQTVRFVRNLGYTPFQSATLGVGALAMLLVVAFVAYGIWTLSKGLKAGANFLSWSIGLVVWGWGLASSRGVLVNTSVFRYRYVALGLVLLAVVPRRPLAWPARLPVATDRRWVVAGALLISVLGTARGLAVRGDMRASATRDRQFGQVVRAATLMVELGPSVVPDDTVLPFAQGSLRADEMRRLFADYGNPFPPARATADQELVNLKIVAVHAAGTRDVQCKPLTHAFRFKPTTPPVLDLWSRTERFAVDVRRFGSDWVRLVQARPRVAVQLTLPGLGVTEPWQVRALGACRVSAHG